MKEKSAAESFLSRWSRRKQTVKIDEPATENPNPPSQKAPEEVVVEKEVAELPVWQRDDVDEETKQQALRDLFRKSVFNQTDGLEEYENDYNYQNFAGLGSVVTHEVKRRLERQLASAEAVEKPQQSVTTSTYSPQQDETASQSTLDEEDKPFA